MRGIEKPRLLASRRAIIKRLAFWNDVLMGRFARQSTKGLPSSSAAS